MLQNIHGTQRGRLKYKSSKLGDEFGFWQMTNLSLMIVFSLFLYIFEIFHHQKNVKPSLKKKRERLGITKSLWSVDQSEAGNIASVFVGIL